MVYMNIQYWNNEIIFLSLSLYTNIFMDGYNIISFQLCAKNVNME